MGFNKGEIRVKATNISIMGREGRESLLGCRVMNRAITTAVSTHSHLNSRVRKIRILCCNFFPGR